MMPDYSEIFLDHYHQPRNLGDLDDRDAVAIVHDATCGDLVRLAVKLDAPHDDVPAAQRTIAEVRFKAFGCAAAIAVASAATELMVGRKVGEVAEIREEALVEAVGGLPAGRMHAAAMVREVIGEVISRL